MDQQPSYEHGLDTDASGTYRLVRTPRPFPAEPAFRVGEAERSAACDALAEHFAAGRLDPAELDDRLARAVAARSQADLQVLFRDLRPRRPVPAAPAGPSDDDHPDARAAVPVLTSVLILCLLLAGGMLMVLGAYSSGLVVAALVGGTTTAVAGGCLTAIGQATLRRR